MPGGRGADGRTARPGGRHRRHQGPVRLFFCGGRPVAPGVRVLDAFVRLAGYGAVLRILQHRLDLELRPQDVLALALAGPVAAERGRLTNGALQLDLAVARQMFVLRLCLLCNAFAAAALATLTPAGEEARLVAGDRLTEGAGPEGFAARAVLGQVRGWARRCWSRQGGAGCLCLRRRGMRPSPSASCTFFSAASTCSLRWRACGRCNRKRPPCSGTPAFWPGFAATGCMRP